MINSWIPWLIRMCAPQVATRTRERTNKHRWHVEVWSQEPKFIESKENSIWIFWNSNQIHRQILQIQANTCCYENDQSVYHVPGDSKLCGNSLLIRSCNEKKEFSIHTRMRRIKRKTKWKSDMGILDFNFFLNRRRQKLAIFY